MTMVAERVTPLRYTAKGRRVYGMHTRKSAARTGYVHSDAHARSELRPHRQRATTRMREASPEQTTNGHVYRRGRLVRIQTEVVISVRYPG